LIGAPIPLQGRPFAEAFGAKVRTALRPFVECKRSHPELAAQLQEQLDCALRHFCNSGNDLLQSSYMRQPWGQWEWPLMMSSPERAILELLDEVPQRETFHQADVLMEGLSNLSPRRLYTLLAACSSVKVKRLFLWFAERHHHSWLKKLDRKEIYLGHGKRVLVQGGKLDPTFNITVPESIDAAG